MDLKKLELFMLVAELGSLSKAAKTADMAQSLVSRNIAQLEQEWGDRLFQRTGRGVILSDFGRFVQPEVRVLLDQASRLESAVKEAAGVPTGTVHVGVLPSMSRQLVAQLFEVMQKVAPAVRLHFIEGFSGYLDEQLLSGRLDFAVINRYGSSPDRGEDVLGYADNYLIGSKQKLPLHQSASFQLLATMPLVLPAAPNGLRSILDQVSRQKGLKLNIALEVDTLSAMKDVALSGVACTILPLFAVSDEVANGRLAAAKIVDPGIRRTITLSISKQRPLSSAARLAVTNMRNLATTMLSLTNNL